MVPFFPIVGKVWGNRGAEVAVACYEVVEIKRGTARGYAQREGGVEVGEGAIDEPGVGQSV